MLVPGGHGGVVPLDADRFENGVPQLGHGRVLRQVREHGFGPAGNGHGGDAPGEPVAHLEPIKDLPENGAGFLGSHQPVRVHALQGLRVAGGNGQVARAHFGVVGEEFLPPLRRVVKHAVLRPEVFHAGQLIVAPVHDDLPAACVVGRSGAQTGEVGALHRGGDDEGLALLDIQSDFDDQFRVFTQFFFHMQLPFIGELIFQSFRASSSFRMLMRTPFTSAPKIRVTAVRFSQISTTMTAPMEP